MSRADNEHENGQDLMSIAASNYSYVRENSVTLTVQQQRPSL